MNRKHPHKTQVPPRVPERPEEPAKLSQWWRPERLHLAVLMAPWSRTAKIGVTIVGTLVLILGSINLVLSTDWIEARVAARIKEKTGHDLTVNGSTLLLFTPGPYIVISDAKITDPNATAGSADLSVGKLKINLDFADLFSPKPEAERIVLVRPVLTVRFGEDAAPTQWSGTGPDSEDAAPRRVRFASAQAASPALQRDGHDIHIKDVRIEDGTVVIVGDDATKERRIEHINVHASLPAIADPLIGSGVFDWKNQTVDFSFEVTSPANLRAERPARLQLALDTKAMAARFDGKISTKPHLSGQGKLSAKASSIPSMLAWMREGPGISNALGDGELASDLSWSRGEITLSNARFALEHASGEGQAVIVLKRPRPHVRAAVAFDHLDLNPFLDSAKKGKPPRAKADDAVAQPASRPTSSTNWFSRPAAPRPAAQGPAAQGDQVEQAITPPPSAAPGVTADPASPPQAAPAPAAFDADVNLNIRKTRAGKLNIGPTSLGLVFRDGVVNASLGGMELYGGHARGTLVVDATKPVPGFNGEFHLDGVKTQPLLTDAAQFKLLSGRAKLNLTISGAGEDAETIKSSLQGNGSLLVTEGAIAGIDLTALIRGLGKGDFNLHQGADAKTSFSDLGGSFTISDGIAETQNLKMVSPLLKVSADGTVDIARSNIDLIARPQITGSSDLAGLSVPVRVEGPLDAPRIQPQIGSIFADTEGASKTVNKIGEALRKKFKGKPVGEAIGRFLGGVQIGGGQAAPQALAQPQAAEPDQGDAGEAMDPELEAILR
jgi:AsmA protein